MPEDKLELELDVNTKEAKEKLDKLANEYTQKKIRLGVDQSEIKKLEQTMVKFQKLIDNPLNVEVKDQLSQHLQGQINKYNELTKTSIACKEEIKSLRREMSNLTKVDIDTSGLQRANGILQKFGGAIYKVGNLVSKLGTNMRVPLVGSGFNWVLKSAGDDVTSFGNTISNLGNKISNAKISMNMFNEAYSRVSDSSQKISRNIFNASNYVDHFSRRIYGLLRNAFIFNVIRRGFKGISDTLFNLIKRDTQFATTLLIVKANLIRAFAPIWQVVLPWIRALGRALVWLSNRLISFINYLAGREIIKPVKEIGEAQKVVSDFMKIASPKKEMFDLEKPAKKSKQLKDNTKKLKDNTKKAAKESNELLASFDKLETLKFNKNGLAKDPFGLEELKKNKNGKDILDNGKDILDNGKANLEVEADTESFEKQIAQAINKIEDQPLEFKVNDNIENQITSEVNGLNLPTLDFKVNADNEELGELTKKIESLGKAITAIGIAFATYKIVSMIQGFIGALAAGKGVMMILGLASPAGWIALIAGVVALIVMFRKEIGQFFNDLWPKIKEFFGKIGDWFKDLWNRLKEFFTNIANGISDFFKYMFDNIKKSLENAAEKVSDFFLDLWNRLKEFFGKIGNWFHGLFTGNSAETFAQNHKPNIPGLAQGSVLNGGDPFLAYLNDQPRGQTNIEAPLSTMVSAFKQALSEGGYNSPTTINLEASGDMSELIRMLNIKISQERIRVGSSFVEGY